MFVGEILDVKADEAVLTSPDDAVNIQKVAPLSMPTIRASITQLGDLLRRHF